MAKTNGVSFKVGDKVVYPNHGVAVVEELRKATALGSAEDFYCLKICANNTRVMVPTTKAQEVGLRRLIEPAKVRKLFSSLKSPEVDTGHDWKERYQDNSDRMRTGEIFEVARVLKNLAVLATSKDLSDREKRMLEKARFLLVSEVAEAESATLAAVEARVDRALSSLIKNA